MQSLKMIALDSLPSGPPDQVENLAVNFLNRFDRIDHLKVKVLLSPDACSRIKWLEGIHRFSVSSVTDLSTYLKVLKGVRQLDCLSIEKASLNKDDIQGIAKLTKLKTLQIVFQAGANPDAEKFQLLGKALPGCQIIPGTAANDDF